MMFFTITDQQHYNYCYQPRQDFFLLKTEWLCVRIRDLLETSYQLTLVEAKEKVWIHLLSVAKLMTKAFFSICLFTQRRSRRALFARRPKVFSTVSTASKHSRKLAFTFAVKFTKYETRRATKKSSDRYTNEERGGRQDLRVDGWSSHVAMLCLLRWALETTYTFAKLITTTSSTNHLEHQPRSPPPADLPPKKHIVGHLLNIHSLLSIENELLCVCDVCSPFTLLCRFSWRHTLRRMSENYYCSLLLITTRMQIFSHTDTQCHQRYSLTYWADYLMIARSSVRDLIGFWAVFTMF